jgi:hypothetical protein
MLLATLVLFQCAVVALAARSAADARKLRVVVLEGSPKERGLAYGRVLKAEIHDAVRRWKAALADAFKIDADTFVRRFIAQTDFGAAIQKWTPGLWEEIHGLAEGAGIDFDTALTLQLPDECFIHGSAIAGNRCSSVGFGKSGGRPACIAQNLDVPSMADGLQAVLHIKDKNGLESFVLTQIGCIGVNGMNNRGIGVCTNALWQLNSGRTGLPVACVVRGLLECQSERDAVAFLRAIPHASGQNYLLGGREHVYSFECSAGRVAQFKPPGFDDVVWHTNHPLANDDYIVPYRELRANPGELAKQEANTRTRMQCLERRLGETKSVRDMDLVKAILASRDSAEYPVCRPKREGLAAFTFASTIMVLAEKPVYYVAPGPPDRTAYEVLSFDKSGW